MLQCNKKKKNKIFLFLLCLFPQAKGKIEKESVYYRQKSTPSTCLLNWKCIKMQRARRREALGDECV